MKQYIQGVFVARLIRSNDTGVFVQSASQEDTALNMRQLADFQILGQDFPVEVFAVPLRTRIKGGIDANNHAIIRKIETATRAQISGLTINRIR